MLAHSFLIVSSSKLLITRTGIKARTSSILGLWFPWPIYMFFEMRFDLGTLDSGERSLPFGLLVILCHDLSPHKNMAVCNDPKMRIILNEKDRFCWEMTHISFMETFQIEIKFGFWKYGQGHLPIFDPGLLYQASHKNVELKETPM